MPDLEAVLRSVRDRLAFVDRRIAELDAQRGELDRERVRLANGIGVMEEHAQPSAAGGTPALEEPPLSTRVLDAVAGSSARTRADLVRIFGPLGINPNTLDSAIARLVKRGELRRHGSQLLPVVDSSAPSPAASSRDSSDAPAVQPDPVRLGTETADSPVPGSTAAAPLADPVPASVSSAVSPPAASVPKTVRVRDAVASLSRATRADLVKFLLPQGLSGHEVDQALYGLRQQGAIRLRPDHVYVLGEPGDPPSAPPAASDP